MFIFIVHGPQCAFGGRRKAPQVLLPSFTMWGPVIELRTSGFITRTCLLNHHTSQKSPNISILKMHIEAGEVAQQVKHLPSKYKDSSLDPQNPHKC